MRLIVLLTNGALLALLCFLLADHGAPKDSEDFVLVLLMFVAPITTLIYLLGGSADADGLNRDTVKDLKRQIEVKELEKRLAELDVK